MMTELTIKIYYHYNEKYVFKKLYKYSCYNRDLYLIEQALDVPFPFNKYTNDGTSIVAVYHNGIIVETYTYNGIGGFVRVNELSRFGKLRVF